MLTRTLLLSSTCLAVLAAADPRLEVVGALAVPGAKACEIVALHGASGRAVASDSERGRLYLLDLAQPASPSLRGTVDLALAAGEEATSVAVHPAGQVMLVAIKAGYAKPGRVELRALDDGALLQQAPAGYGPDSVTFSPDGRLALVCNEGEEFTFDAASKAFATRDGSLTLVRLDAQAATMESVQMALSDQSATAGFTPADAGRTIERLVDLNGNGTIEEEIDLDGNGAIEKGNTVVVGTFAGVEVVASEDKGEAVQIPLRSHAPALLEPECAAFSPDGATAWVTLQENNGLAVVDLASATVRAYWGLGTSAHPADVTDDKAPRFEATLTALRESDGITCSSDGRWLFTGDEGDTDPKASKVKAGKLAGGSRTVTVYDAATGAVLGDTGNQIDEHAAQAGCYPDKRSPNKGSEPEMIAAFTAGGVQYLVAGLERADAVALIRVVDPAKPEVLSVLPLGKGHSAPEGIATWTAADGTCHAITANEKSASLTVLRLVQ